MKEDRFRYSKFGLVNALLSLIPIFPTWTVFPGVLYGIAVGEIIDNCEFGYSFTLWTCMGLAVFLLFRYFKRYEHDNRNTTVRRLKKNFRLFSLMIYTLLNTAILIVFVGPNLACYGDGQTLLAVIYSGPLASIGLILLGVAVDVKIKISAANSSQNHEDGS